MAVCCLGVTFVVVVAVLAPMYGLQGYRMMLFSGDMIVLSMALMAALFLCLALIFTTAYEHDRSRRDRLLIRVPFGVYFGWITVATIANMTANACRATSRRHCGWM